MFLSFFIIEPRFDRVGGNGGDGRGARGSCGGGVVLVEVVAFPFSESVNLICGSAPLLLLMVQMMVRWLGDGHFHFSKNIFTMMESARKWERIFFLQILCVADLL